MTVVNEQVSTDEIRHTRTVRETIMSDHSTARLKFDPREEIPELLRWRPILQGDAQQTGDDVVQPDQLGGAVGAFHTQKDFSGVRVVMDAEVEGPLTGNADLLGDMVPAVGEGQPMAHAASTSRSMAKLRGRSVV